MDNMHIPYLIAKDSFISVSLNIIETIPNPGKIKIHFRMTKKPKQMLV